MKQVLNERVATCEVSLLKNYCLNHYIRRVAKLVEASNPTEGTPTQFTYKYYFRRMSLQSRHGVLTHCTHKEKICMTCQSQLSGIKKKENISE